MRTCPHCGGAGRTLSSVNFCSCTRRRRACRSCGKRWTTIELRTALLKGDRWGLWSPWQSPEDEPMGSLNHDLDGMKA